MGYELRNHYWDLAESVHLAVSIASAIADVIFVDFQSVESGGAATSMKTWNNHLVLLMFIPMLSTNVYATALISYRAWYVPGQMSPAVGVF